LYLQANHAFYQVFELPIWKNQSHQIVHKS